MGHFLGNAPICFLSENYRRKAQPLSCLFIMHVARLRRQIAKQCQHLKSSKTSIMARIKIKFFGAILTSRLFNMITLETSCIYWTFKHNKQLHMHCSIPKFQISHELKNSNPTLLTLNCILELWGWQLNETRQNEIIIAIYWNILSSQLSCLDNIILMEAKIKPKS